MREIKFRAWRKNKNSMVEVDDIHFNFPHDGTVCNIWYVDGISTEFADGENVILMQYTGLKDKNGKEIYEGDIVKTYTMWVLCEEAIAEVIFYEGAYCITFDGIRKSTIEPMTSVSELREVIGNIYENPELLG